MIFFPQGPSVPYSEAPECAREKLPEWRIDVSSEVRLSHPLVKKTRAPIADQLKPPKNTHPYYVSYRARMVNAPKGCLNLAVSREMAPRALQILDALLTGLDTFTETRRERDCANHNSFGGAVITNRHAEA